MINLHIGGWSISVLDLTFPAAVWTLLHQFHISWSSYWAALLEPANSRGHEIHILYGAASRGQNWLSWRPQRGICYCHSNKLNWYLWDNFTERCRNFFSIQFLFGQELQIIIARQFSKAYVSARTRLSWFHLELTLSPPLPPVGRAAKYGTVIADGYIFENILITMICS